MVERIDYINSAANEEEVAWFFRGRNVNNCHGELQDWMGVLSIFTPEQDRIPALRIDIYVAFWSGLRQSVVEIFCCCCRLMGHREQDLLSP